MENRRRKYTTHHRNTRWTMKLININTLPQNWYSTPYNVNIVDCSLVQAFVAAKVYQTHSSVKQSANETHPS